MDQRTFQGEPSFAEASPVLNDEQTYLRQQRVPVTASMLYAYAAMRGNVDKDLNQSDPLHRSLFLNPTTCLRPQFEQRVDMPGWQILYDSHMMQELAPGSIFFHDLSGPMYMNPSTPHTPLQNDYLNGPPVIYEKHKLQNPYVCPNHYKGDEGYGNYGYAKVNGCWVDPDSQKELHEAFTNHASHFPNLPIGIRSAPHLYEEEIYRNFMVELQTEGGDGEGDPRALYITPATFARWAAGAFKGDCYSGVKVPPQDPPLRELRGRSRTRKPPLVRHQVQFCHETGSAFSGEYSPERSPSLCMSTRTIDMAMQPIFYSYSYPQEALDLERAAYGGFNYKHKSKEQIVDWLAKSAASTIVPFTEDNAIEFLADPMHNDRNTGLKQWNKYVGDINNLHEEFREDLLRSVDKRNQRFQVGMEAHQFYKEVYFMEQLLNKRNLAVGTLTRGRSIARDFSRPAPAKPAQPKLRQIKLPTSAKGPFYQSSRDSMAGTSKKASFQLSLRKPSFPPSVEGSAPCPLRHKQQFERFFEERREREIINVNKIRMTNAELGVDLNDLSGMLQEVKLAHAHYLDALGVESVSEIPNLIPQRKKSSDYREEMNKKLGEAVEK